MRADTLHAALRALPLATLEEIVPDTAMILAPHADDESLGCGGLIAGLCAAGRPPVVVVVTDGTGSHPSSTIWPAERLRVQRETEAQAAVSTLGLAAERVIFLRLPDTRSPHEGVELELAVERLSQLAAVFQCTSVLATWAHDPHCDHESVWKMGRALAARDGLRLLAYPVWGWLIAPDAVLDAEAPQGWQLDITLHMDTKAAAIRAHESQYGDLITDDPTGFRLPAELLQVFEAPREVFLLP